MMRINAFDRGYMAYEEGLLEDDNPYNSASYNYIDWLRGYHQAAIDCGEELYVEEDSDMP